MKRIGLICRSRSLHSTTDGLTSAIISWISAWLRMGYSVDLITEESDLVKEIVSQNINVIAPKDTVPISRHAELFQFKDGFNVERMLNLRNGLVKALRTNYYDVLVANEIESALLLYQLGIYRYIKCVYQCHEPGTFFTDSDYVSFHFKDYLDFIRLGYSKFPFKFAVLSKDVQSQMVALGNDVIYLPFPVMDKAMLNKVETEQNGVYFSGRIEVRKNFDFFVETLDKIRREYGEELVAKVMTKPTHVKKAEALFREIGYTNFDVRGGIPGDEKWDFISSAKVGFHPASQETYGLAAYESLRYHPTVFIDDYSWYHTFDGFANQVVTSKEDVARTIYAKHKELAKPNNGLSDFLKIDEEFRKCWSDFFESPIERPESVGVRSRFVKILSENKDTWYRFSDVMGLLEPYLVNFETVYHLSNFRLYNSGKECYVTWYENESEPSLVEQTENTTQQLRLF